MCRIAVVGSLLACTFDVFNQPTVQWQKCLGGSSGESASCIQQTPDGGFIVAGSSGSTDGDVSGNHGGADCWVVKLGVSGNIHWQKSLGGSGTDKATSIQMTTDGGYIVAGYTTSNDGDVSGHYNPGVFNYDYWVLKLDNFGAVQWQRCLGGTGSDLAHSIRQTSDGGYIVAGESFSNDGDVIGHHGGADQWLVKLHGNGAFQWQRCLGGSGWDVASDVWPTTDGGYIVAGWTGSHDGDIGCGHGEIAEDFWLVKLNGNGQTQWQRCLGGTLDDRASAIQQTSDGGYIVVGYTASEFNDGDVSGVHGGADYWLVKLNDVGSMQWQKCLGGSSTDFGYSVDETTDGGYVAAGWTGSSDGDVSGVQGSWDYWVVKLSESGILQWQKCLGGMDWDHAGSIQQTEDGGYIIAGLTGSNEGDVSGNHGNWDYWVVKLGPDDVGVVDLNKPRVKLGPNPTDGLITVSFAEEERLRSVSWIDVSGRIVQENTLFGTAHSITFDLGEFENGLYLLRMEFNNAGWLVERVEKH